MIVCGPAWYCPVNADGPVNCDLLLHFNDAQPGDWQDSSINQHAISLSPFGSGPITSTTNGKFDGGAEIIQAWPAETSGHINQQSYIAAAGTYSFGSDEFVVCLWTDRGPPAGSNSLEYGYLSNVSNSNLGGFSLRLQSDGAGGGVLSGGFAAGGLQATGAIGAVLAKNHVLLCRKNRPSGFPSNDVLFIYWNGVKVGFAVLTAGFSAVGTLRSDLLIGCRIDAAGTNAGYQGMLDEVYINHGPGTGLDANFTPPTIPFDNLHTFRQVMGLDPY